MSNRDVDADLLALYVERKVLTPEHLPVHLPTECPHGRCCWAGVPAEQTPSTTHLASQISAPWIGSKYQRGRTVLVLENLRDYGGFDLREDATVGMRFLGRSARHAFASGKKRIFRTDSTGYPGTLVWHRAAGYAALWLDAHGLLDVRRDAAARLDGDALAAAMDRIAVIQHVKCSPNRGRGEQEPAMWERCGPHLLAGELAILKPERLIVLGSSDNYAALRPVLGGLPASDPIETVVMLGRRRATVRIESWKTTIGPLQLLVVPHPAAPGGTARRLLDAVRDLGRRPEPQ